jgi:hypothetical protein
MLLQNFTRARPEARLPTGPIMSGWLCERIHGVGRGVRLNATDPKGPWTTVVDAAIGPSSEIGPRIALRLFV